MSKKRNRKTGSTWTTGSQDDASAISKTGTPGPRFAQQSPESAPPRSIVARIWRTKIAWLPLLVVVAMFTVDRAIAEQQKRAFRVSVTRHVMAALQDEADARMDQTLRAHWIATDDEGNLEGRISAIDNETADSLPIEKLSVSLLKGGQKVRKSKTDEDGRFVLEDVPKGVYTLVASGKSGFLAYGVHVLPALKDLDLDEFDFDARNFTSPQRQAFYVSYFNLPQEAVVKEELQIDAAAVPPQFTTLRRISQNYLSASSALSVQADTDDLKALNKASFIRGGFQFPLSPEGDFNGRIQPIATEDGRPTRLSEMNLFLIQDDVEMARVAAEDNGEFKIENVDPGVYALLAAGKDGFAAMSLELVAADPEDDEAGDNAGLSAKADAAYVSTVAPGKQAGKVKIPALGIAIVTDPEDLKFVRGEIKKVAGFDEIVLNGENGAPVEVFNGGGGGSGGFAPGGSGFAPTSSGFAPSGSSFSAPAGSFTPGGFTPTRGFGLNAPAAAPLTTGLSGVGSLAGLGGLAGSSGGLLSVAALAGGITAIADNSDSSDPPAASTAEPPASEL